MTTAALVLSGPAFSHLSPIIKDLVLFGSTLVYSNVTAPQGQPVLPSDSDRAGCRVKGGDGIVASAYFFCAGTQCQSAPMVHRKVALRVVPPGPIQHSPMDAPFLDIACSQASR